MTREQQLEKALELSCKRIADEGTFNCPAWIKSEFKGDCDGSEDAPCELCWQRYFMKEANKNG